jgi:DMSO reductase anchor subunit
MNEVDMKGIIQAYALFVLLMGIALGYMLYIRIDEIQYMARMILNQSVHDSMVMLDKMSIAEREDRLIEVVNENIQLRDEYGLIKQVQVLGYHLEPLALRVKLTVKLSDYEWNFDETMIEVGS